MKLPGKDDTMESKSGLSEISEEKISSLAWLADAPLFIDCTQIASFYDAVVRPEYETDYIEFSLKDTNTKTFLGKVEGGTDLSVAKWLKKIFPFLDAKVSAKIEGEAKKEKTEENDEMIRFKPISTPQRQLVQLALHYVLQLPDRVKIVNKPGETDWTCKDFISKIPRGLVYIDFPPQTKFIPMATEVDQGNVVVIYEELKKKFIKNKEKCPCCYQVPTYPEPAYFIDKHDELIEKRKEYWRFFEEMFSSTVAMEAVEDNVRKGGKIRWIDYRVPLSEVKEYLHLHICGRGQYDTGVFAYDFIKRGFKHGVRIVGTIKSEPALNVLAIFEK